MHLIRSVKDKIENYHTEPQNLANGGSLVEKERPVRREPILPRDPVAPRSAELAVRQQLVAPGL